MMSWLVKFPEASSSPAWTLHNPTQWPYGQNNVCLYHSPLLRNSASRMTELLFRREWQWCNDLWKWMTHTQHGYVYGERELRFKKLQTGEQLACLYEALGGSPASCVAWMGPEHCWEYSPPKEVMSRSYSHHCCQCSAQWVGHLPGMILSWDLFLEPLVP